VNNIFQSKSLILRSITSRVSFVAGLVFLLSLVTTLPVQAQTYTVLYSFASSYSEWAIGPNSALIQDPAGNLYGTTLYGGSYGDSLSPLGYGTIFKLDPSGNAKVLHAFNTQVGKTDGAFPSSPVIRDAAGNLYGTTLYGGDPNCGCGTVYKLGAHGLTVLHAFTLGGFGAGNPTGGLFREPWGVIYGTASQVPGYAVDGTVFRLDTSNNYRVLHTFTGGADGQFPTGPLVGGKSAGIFYGVTAGTIFAIDATGNETVLYEFTGGTDGVLPAGLLLDAAKNLYGTAEYGGDPTCQCGVVFKLDALGQYSVLHTFTRVDGAFPAAPLVEDAAGNLYGTTTQGGASNFGVVFKVDTAGNYSVLYNFTGGADGATPNGLLLGTDGSLYGTAQAGGLFSNVCSSVSGCGVVFKLTL
jgi:uncharacterized repeat protein (TIGR03803 family)